MCYVRSYRDVGQRNGAAIRHQVSISNIEEAFLGRAWWWSLTTFVPRSQRWVFEPQREINCVVSRQNDAYRQGTIRKSYTEYISRDTWRPSPGLFRNTEYGINNRAKACIRSRPNNDHLLSHRICCAGALSTEVVRFCCWKSMYGDAEGSLRRGTGISPHLPLECYSTSSWRDKAAAMCELNLVSP